MGQDRTVPITTSGKIARRWCKRAYDEGTFQTVHEWRADPSENGVGGGSGGGSGSASVGADEGEPGGVCVCMQ